MRAYIASGSRLPILAKCAASSALPRFGSINEKATVGDALHLHMNERVALGVAESCRVDRLQAIAESCELGEKNAGIFQARAMHFEWSPPKGTLTELPLCLYDDGRVELCTGGKGQYEVGPGALIPTQVDLMWAEPQPLYRDDHGRIRCPPGSVLWVADLKTGKEVYVDPVERNLQTAAETVLAAIWTGAEIAMPAIIFWGKGRGVWDTLPAPLEGPQLALWLDALRRLVAAGRAQEAAHARGEPLSYTTGRQCEFCDCAPGCPAKVGLLKAFVGGNPLDAVLPTLEQAREIAIAAPMLTSLAKQATAFLKRYADAIGPIPLDPGKAWGPYITMETELDVDKVLPLLADEVGEELADAALTRELSKSACDDAIRAAHAAQGIKKQKAAAMRRLMGKARDAGGLVDVVKTKYGPHAVALELGPAGNRKLVPAPQPEEIEGDDA